MSRFRTSQARDTPVAALVTKSERQPPNIMVVPSISMHPPPTLARRPTGKAVLALEVRSRALHRPCVAKKSGRPLHSYSYSVLHGRGARERLWSLCRIPPQSIQASSSLYSIYFRPRTYSVGFASAARSPSCYPIPCPMRKSEIRSNATPSPSTLELRAVYRLYTRKA